MRFLRAPFTLSKFIKKAAHFIFLFTNFLGKKYLIKRLFNELKTTLEQRLNKPLDEHYRQVVMYVIPLYVY